MKGHFIYSVRIFCAPGTASGSLWNHLKGPTPQKIKTQVLGHEVH